MDKLIPAIRAKLKDDTVLSDIVSDVRYWRAPREPKKLIKPVIVFNISNFADKGDTHGAASLPFIEVDVWGYDQNNAQVIEVTKAANRVANLLTTGRLDIDGGGTTRVSLNTGWNTLPEQDPNTIHLQGRFVTSYWSLDRIELINQ